MSSTSIHYNKVVIPFPRNSELEVSELTALFKVRDLGTHIKFLQNGTWHNQYPDSFFPKFIVPTDVGDVYLVGIPEEDPKYENNNMNIVPQSSSVESLEFLTGGPTAAGGASLMLSPLMLTPHGIQQHQLICQQAIPVLFIKQQGMYPIVVLLEKEEMLPTAWPCLKIYEQAWSKGSSTQTTERLQRIFIQYMQQ